MNDQVIDEFVCIECGHTELTGFSVTRDANGWAICPDCGAVLVPV
ncbi:hypothetical protein [Acinetobacter junii]|nr:hypothetical protein [Acinetobacter junii]